ncbi:MAG: ATP-binding protein [Burkholderiaceae bacterium]|nr:ATP-binding protein [Burkholderiaceae bacterium]
MSAGSVAAATTAARRPRPISLFWRTFGLVALLIVASFVATITAAGLLERAPPEQRLAWEIASVVNLTRSALVSAEPDRRLQLLDELAQQEEVRVLPKEPADRIDPSATGPRLRALEPRLRALLGGATRVAGRVNDVDAVWISFEIDGDDYWLILPRDRVERQFGPSLVLLSMIAAAFALVGAIVISRLVNRPLSDLAGAIGLLSRGRAPAPLAESGPTEIAAVNRRFNRLAADLAQLDADRALALAGISHDIRNPLARLRIEVELARLADAQRESMVDDIERIDRIVGQFIGYAQIAQPPRAELVDVSASIASIANAYRAEVDAGTLELSIDADEGLRWYGDPTDLQRAIGNVVDNALHHARGNDSDRVRVELLVRSTGAGIALALRDDGPGIADEDAERLLRPFARVDRARGEHGGSGLGLAIVDRLARRYGGRARLSNDARGGLRVDIELPDYRVAPGR